MNGLQVSVPQGSCGSSAEIEKDVDLFVRPEQVMIIWHGKPVKDSLRRNIFEGEIVDLTGRGRHADQS